MPTSMAPGSVAVPGRSARYVRRSARLVAVGGTLVKNGEQDGPPAHGAKAVGADRDVHTILQLQAVGPVPHHHLAQHRVVEEGPRVAEHDAALFAVASEAHRQRPLARPQEVPPIEQRRGMGHDQARDAALTGAAAGNDPQFPNSSSWRIAVGDAAFCVRNRERKRGPENSAPAISAWAGEGLAEQQRVDEDKQQAFIENYEKLLNSLGDDEAVLFADAVLTLFTLLRAVCERADHALQWWCGLRPCGA
jgi:hypothetical protein